MNRRRFAFAALCCAIPLGMIAAAGPAQHDELQPPSLHARLDRIERQLARLADDLAAEVEPGLSQRDALAIIAAAVAGPQEIWPTGTVACASVMDASKRRVLMRRAPGGGWLSTELTLPDREPAPEHERDMEP